MSLVSLFLLFLWSRHLSCCLHLFSPKDTSYIGLGPTLILT